MTPIKKTVCIVLVWIITSGLVSKAMAEGHAFDKENFRVALVQMDSSKGKKTNLDKIASFTAKAAGNRADIVCFPELSITGYTLDRPILHAETIPGASSNTILRLSRQYRIIILTGLIEKEESRLYITQLAVFPDGRVETYRKTHLGRRERRVFSHGNRLPVFKALNDRGQAVSFAIGICYDMHFPELAAQYALKGALIIFSPHASPLGGIKRIAIWDRYLGARAYDNSLYVAACNHLGHGGATPWGGGIGIWEPSTADMLKAQTSPNEAILYYDLDLAALERKRNKKNKTFYIKDRRGQLYCLENPVDP